MRDSVKFPVLPELSAIDFSSAAGVRELVRERFQHLFGPADDGYIDEYMEAIEGLFAGDFPEYQPIDTAYHDITHTLQATLCLVELLHRRHFTNATPVVEAGDFKRAVIATLFHDLGYLKAVGDNEGTGAKYTHVHEQRSCRLVRAFLEQRCWSEDDIVFVENLISATGPLANLTKIPFRSAIERLLGQAVCTADYVGQMSDPQYPDKLEVLFHEFEESYRYQGIPKAKWPFADYESLLRSTPNFWNKFVQYKMNVECGGLWQYLRHPVTGENPYIDSIHRNLDIIDQRIAGLKARGTVALRIALGQTA
jgi:hypothetical protein